MLERALVGALIGAGSVMSASTAVAQQVVTTTVVVLAPPGSVVTVESQGQSAARVRLVSTATGTAWGRYRPVGVEHATLCGSRFVVLGGRTSAPVLGSCSEFVQPRYGTIYYAPGSTLVTGPSTATQRAYAQPFTTLRH